MKGRALALVAIAWLVAQGMPAAAHGASRMGVEFRWAARHECGRANPEIRLSGVPAGTVALGVELADLDVPEFRHGGGTVRFTGGNVIAEGAVGFRLGPCPPSGDHRYRITVEAIDAGGRVIGRGAAVRRCCARF